MSEPIPASVQSVIDAYLAGLEPLRHCLYGSYIFGSIALGAFEEQESDIDILILTHRRLMASEVTQLKALHSRLKCTHPLSKRLEALYVPLTGLGKCDEEIAPYPYFHRAKFFPAGYAAISYITWWIIKHKSICLFGVDRSALPFEVTWQDVLKTMHDNLNGYWANNARQFYLFLLDGWVVIAITTLCRILTTIEEARIVPKSEALKLWRDRLPACWSLLIDEAWRIRHHCSGPSLYPSRLKRMREVLAFIAYVQKRGNKGLEELALTENSIEVDIL